jgi:VWFA-related protein
MNSSWWNSATVRSFTVPFTADTEEMQKKVARTQPLGRTALLDAVQLALVQMKKARNTRKAIVILSDGADNRSRSTFYQVKNAVIESGVQVYAMGIFDAIEGKKGTPEEQNGPKLLDELTEESGGQHFRANTPDELPGISARINRELRSQYLIGYSPDDLASDGKYHRIKLQLVPPPHLPTLRVHYRPGFYAPGR